MTRPRWTWRCATCHATFTAWAPAEKHADAHHGARLDLDLETDR